MASLVFFALPQQAAEAEPSHSYGVSLPTYSPHRVYDARRRRFTDFEAMVADVTTADVLFLGEEHDDPVTHELEAATLAGLARRRSNVVIALEMFERDVQPQIDSYLAGSTTEDEFLASTRPWARYRTDYRPLLEFARVWKWPVIASNVPRRLAQVVSRLGLGSLDSLPASDRMLVALQIACPHDGYFDRFAKAMSDMPSHSGDARQQTANDRRTSLERVYQAQCVKDETMGEAIAAAFGTAPPRALVVHVNGAFHSDFHEGTASRARRRLRGKRLMVVRFQPVRDLDATDGELQKKSG